jgi:DNA-directed RNA polymerase subunit M/transcription elongation factor TFIIS
VITSKTVESGVYNCRNCGYVARINAEAEHVHEHEHPGEYDDK